MTTAKSKTVPLSGLKPGHEYPGESVNSRTAYRDQEIEQLGRSLISPDEGQLKPLLVCRTPASQFLFVFDGNRRLEALKWAFREKLIDASHPIEVRDFGEIEPRHALQLSWAANEQVPLHPADRFAVFAEMQATGKAPAEIAEARGMTTRAVEQSLALGGKLAPEVLDAWRAGEINQDLAKIFTLGDPEEQVEELKKQRAGKHLKPWQRRRDEKWSERVNVEQDLRKAFAGNEAEAVRLLKFVGEAEYLAAGGEITQDLFGEKPVSVVQDIAKLKKLAKKKLQDRADKLTADGWSWVDVSLAPSFYDYNYDKSADKKKAGCVVRIAGSKIEVKSGLVKRKSGVGSSSGYSTPTREESAENYNANDAINDTRSAAVGDALLKDRLLALSVLCAYAGVRSSGSIEVNIGEFPDELGITHVKTFDQALDEFRKLDEKALTSIVVQAICGSIRVPTYHGQPLKAGKLLDLLDQPTLTEALPRQFKSRAKDYFSGCSAKHLLDVIGESLGPDQKRQNEKKAKDALAKFCIASVTPTGWLPKQLRSGGYAGPGAKPAAAEKKPAKLKKAA